MPELPPIVPPTWLVQHRDDVVVADVRWYLDGRSGRAAHEAGHVPGAVFVDVDTVLAGPASPAAGRHPLPDPAAFAAGLSALGIGDGTTVVAYDDVAGSVAARLVWLLRVTGHEAALLDGGLAAWDGPLETGPVASRPAPFTPVPWPVDRLATADEAAAAAVLVDARAPERFRGDVEPVDPRAGHVPGAVNVPSAGNCGPDGRFLPAADLAARYRAVGIAPGVDAVVSCGSGVTACHDLLALELAGVPGARLWPGSWSQWSADPARPVATGS